MKSNTKKLALAGVLCAVAVVGSMFSFPVFGSKCAPVQLHKSRQDAAATPAASLCMVLPFFRRCFIITYITLHHICDNCKEAGKSSMQGRVCGPMRALAPTICRYI